MLSQSLKYENDKLVHVQGQDFDACVSRFPTSKSIGQQNRLKIKAFWDASQTNHLFILQVSFFRFLLTLFSFSSSHSFFTLFFF